MNKQQLVQHIIELLAADLAVLTRAARTAHEAATHEECLPDNKYDTTALEASYVAQGQANRAQEIRVALEAFRTLVLVDFAADDPVRLTALLQLEDGAGRVRRFFLAPAAGGMKVLCADDCVVVITPGSPLGRKLLGLRAGDEVQADVAAELFTITAVS